MREPESSKDCNQDLTIFMREVEEVVRETMGDSYFKGHQHYKFEAEFDQTGKGCWRVGASAGVAFKKGQIRYCIYQGYTCQNPGV